MRFKHLLRGAASAMVLAGFAGAGQALAQEQDEVTTFDELVVTAQKREQRLQDVPIVVTVVTEQLLEDAGVKDIRDLSILAPGLTVTATSSEASVTARIRGIGTVGDNPGLESSVGVVIDGVYRPRNGVGFGDLGNVSRIEVLKGPQGTLFGKNTSAGVISVITKEPSFEPGAELELTGGNFNAFGGSVNLTGPIIADKLAGSLFAAARSRDGFLDVQTLNTPGAPTEANDQSYFTVRGQLLALPNDRFSGRIIADYSERDESCCAAPSIFYGGSTATNHRGFLLNNTRPGALDLTATEFNRVAYANRPYVQQLDDMGISGEFNYDINDDVRLTSISAYRKFQTVTGSDTDYSAADVFYVPGDGSNGSETTQLSQEFRLAGERGQLNWLLGFFGAKEEFDGQAVLSYGSDFYAFWDARVLGNFPATTFGSPAGAQHAPGVARIDNHAQESTTFAVFTNNDYAVNDALTLTLGLRYTSEEKELVSNFRTFSESCRRAESAPAGASPALVAVVRGQCVPFMNADFDAISGNTQTLDEDEGSGTLKAAYRFNEDIMAYVSASRGYKAGGFNFDRESIQCAPDGTPFVATFPAQPTGQPFVGASPLPTHSGCPLRAGAGGQVLNTGRPGLSHEADRDTGFAPEIVDAFEIGAKTTLFDNNLLVNVAYFNQEYTDFQLNTFDGLQFVVVTIPEVTSKGVDADFLWNTPIAGLSIQGGATWADTVIGSYEPTDFPNFADYGPVSHLQNQNLSFAPEFTASLAATFETEISDSLIFRANFAAKYNGDYNTGSDLNVVKHQEAYTVVNGRLGIGAPDDKWRIELWAQNLFEEDYLQVGFNGPLQVTTNAQQTFGQDPGVVNNPTSVHYGFLGAPRTFGITLRSKL